MKNNAQLEQGQFTFNDIHRYLRDGCYPDSYTKPDKLALKKQAKFFCTKGADLIYVKIFRGSPFSHDTGGIQNLDPMLDSFFQVESGHARLAIGIESHSIGAWGSHLVS